ncbi:MAG: SRPBCC family protein [Chloracidobacterium sp.]|nr:SRPBCC family protein [Chloracidobacterium sp.]
MKYSQSVTIDKPLEEVIALFDNVDNMYEWMEGLESFEHLEGTPGEVGAKSRLKFDMNGRKIEMIETITVKNLPDEFTGTYDADGVHNIVRNHFEPLGDAKTLYRSDNEFQFKGFMKIIAFFMPGAFKKQSMKYLEAFKRFAESK